MSDSGAPEVEVVRTLLSQTLFRDMPDAQIEAFLRRAVARRYPAGARVLVEGSAAQTYYLLARGAVQVLYTGPDGRDVAAKIFAAPAAFGEMECLTGIPYLESVDTLESTLLFEVPRAVLLDFLRTSHALARNLVLDLAARLCIAAHNERSLAFDSVESRLASALCTYADLFGVPVEGGVKIRVPLSQDNLAGTIGAVRRSVTRALQRFAKAGWVQKEGRHFVVKDRAALAAESGPTLSIGYRLGEPLRGKTPIKTRGRAT